MRRIKLIFIIIVSTFNDKKEMQTNLHSLLFRYFHLVDLVAIYDSWNVHTIVSGIQSRLSDENR